MLILTGDNKSAAAAVAGRLGLDQRAGLLPEQKIEAIRARGLGGLGAWGLGGLGAWGLGGLGAW
jgi:Cd2+/Zn2+-exporting ATPase